MQCVSGSVSHAVCAMQCESTMQCEPCSVYHAVCAMLRYMHIILIGLYTLFLGVTVSFWNDLDMLTF